MVCTVYIKKYSIADCYITAVSVICAVNVII